MFNSEQWVSALIPHLIPSLTHHWNWLFFGSKFRPHALAYTPAIFTNNNNNKKQQTRAATMITYVRKFNIHQIYSTPNLTNFVVNIVDSLILSHTYASWGNCIFPIIKCMFIHCYCSWPDRCCSSIRSYPICVEFIPHTATTTTTTTIPPKCSMFAEKKN